MDLQEVVNLRHRCIFKPALAATNSGVDTGLKCGLSPLPSDN